MDTLRITTLDNSTAIIEAAVFNQFRSGLRGTSVIADDPEYNEMRKIWNGLIDKYPAIIVKCSGVADVIDTVNFARNHNILVAVRGGGHNVAGNSVCDGGIVIDLSLMNNVRVDEKARRAYVGGGALLSDVDRETQNFGLAAPLGVVSLTGVAGLTLCGGLGYLRRKHGLSCDALASVEVVTASGKLVRASKTENSDLYWGICGGGGNFGVVTSFEFELYPVGPTVTLCAPFYPLEQFEPEMVQKWHEFMAVAPEEVTSNLIFWSVPALPGFPADLHGRPVVIPSTVHIGNPNTVGDLLKPLHELGNPILDLSGPISFVDLQSAFDPMFVKAERKNYWKSLYLESIDNNAIDRILARARSRPDPWSMIILWHLGGAMNRVDPRDTALGVRNVKYLLSLDTSWIDSKDNEMCIGWTRDTWAEMQSFSNGALYLNFPGQGEEGENLLRASYGNDNYDQLVSLKRKYDPLNLFRLNQNILPG